MRCPICNGTGIIVSERQPQGKRKERTCVICGGTGEVEEVKTDRPIITIYKAHGIYATDPAGVAK
jgi:RecJ-like exonuclease